MKVEDFFLAINVELDVSYHLISPAQSSLGGAFHVRGRNCDLKGDGVIIGEYGVGSTPKKALSDYAKQISNKRLVVNALGMNRREYNVPNLVPKPRATKKKVAKKKKTSGS